MQFTSILLFLTINQYLYMILGKKIDQFVVIDHESMRFLKKLFHCFFQPLQNFPFIVWHQCTTNWQPPFYCLQKFLLLLFRFSAAIIKWNNNLIISLLTFILFSCPWQLCIDTYFAIWYSQISIFVSLKHYHHVF